MNTLTAATLDFPEETTEQPKAAPVVAASIDTNANREEYYKRVCTFLINMVAGEWVELSSLLGSPIMKVEEKRQHFIEACKRFMDEGRPWYHFGDMYFNDDYTRIYKCEVAPELRMKK